MRTLSFNHIYNANAMKTEHIVYHVFEPITLELLYIGNCALNQFVHAPDLRSNAQFRSNIDYLICSHGVYADKSMGMQEQGIQVELMREMPPYNKKGRVNFRTPIKCNETGEVFRTIKDAAFAHGCGQSNLSNHLNNRVGFRSVKGKTYHHINNG